MSDDTTPEGVIIPAPKQAGPCDCWASFDVTLPHEESCATLVGKPPGKWWLLLARITMELLRHPSTPVTVQRGRYSRHSIQNTDNDNKLFTLRFMVDLDGEERVWPDRYAGEDYEVAEALSTTLAEQALALSQGKEPGPPRTPPTEQQLLDALEVAYWQFDTLHKTKHYSERDAFKLVLRDLLQAITNGTLSDWSGKVDRREGIFKQIEQHPVELATKTLANMAEGNALDLVAVEDLCAIVLEERGIDMAAVREQIRAKRAERRDLAD